MPKDKETKPGAVDDDATKRIKDRKKKREDIMREIFFDNKSGGRE